jgi:hypothetical protein
MRTLTSGWYWVQNARGWCVARYTGHDETGYFTLCGSAEMLTLEQFPDKGMRLGERIAEPAP